MQQHVLLFKNFNQFLMPLNENDYLQKDGEPFEVYLKRVQNKSQQSLSDFRNRPPLPSDFEIETRLKQLRNRKRSSSEGVDIPPVVKKISKDTTKINKDIEREMKRSLQKQSSALYNENLEKYNAIIKKAIDYYNSKIKEPSVRKNMELQTILFKFKNDNVMRATIAIEQLKKDFNKI